MVPMKQFKGKSTTAVHSGDHLDEISGSVNTPIYQTSTFFFPSADKRTWEGEVPGDSYIYTRYGNPTIDAAQDKIASLEGGEKALVFGSGMAAISTSLLTLLKPGEEIVSVEDVYGGTFSLMKYHLPLMGIETNFVPSTRTNDIIEAMDDDTGMVYLESPTNPMLRIVDIPSIVEAAHERGVLVAIDSTFATPINMNPLEMGVDMVLHSCTKYLNGHTDLIAGAVVAREELIDPIYKKRIALGGVLDPMGAYLLIRGLKTLDIRMQRHNQNGMEIARFLEDHPKVGKVHYPGLESHPQHELANRLMRGYGGMVSIEVKGGIKGAKSTLKGLKLIRRATSLGGVDSLASMPLLSSHASLSPEERKLLGIPDSLIRLSIGIEDIEDLKEDLDQALRRS